jgi:hypothetical protein
MALRGRGRGIKNSFIGKWSVFLRVLNAKKK